MRYTKITREIFILGIYVCVFTFHICKIFSLTFGVYIRKCDFTDIIHLVYYRRAKSSN